MKVLLKDNRDTEGYREWGFDNQFYIIVNKIEVFVHNINSRVDMDRVECAKKTQYKKGYYEIYASTYNPANPQKDRKPSPIGETENKLRKGMGNFIYQWTDEPGVWHFHGNHEKYSGVFHYIIWDESIIKQLQKILKTKIETYGRLK